MLELCKGDASNVPITEKGIQTIKFPQREGEFNQQN